MEKVEILTLVFKFKNLKIFFFFFFNKELKIGSYFTLTFADFFSSRHLGYFKEH